MPSSAVFGKQVAVENSRWSLFAGEFRTEIGGVVVSCADISLALEVLRASSSLMIRQPLVKAANPLAVCDYLAVAAPYRERFSASQRTGKGAAGRHIAKQAFCAALEERLLLITEHPEEGLAHLLEEAYLAIHSDHAYSAAMARTAVSIKAKRHTWDLRSQLRQAAHRALSECDTQNGEFECQVESACGTGACRFAQGLLREVADAIPDRERGHSIRPANHVRAGESFSPDDGIPALERISRFRVTALWRMQEDGLPCTRGRSGPTARSTSSRGGRTSPSL